MKKKSKQPTLPSVPSSGVKYPHTLYSLKIDYIDVREECGEGPGEIIYKPGPHREVRCSYHNQGSFLDFLQYFAKDYPRCTIKTIALIKVIFTDAIHRGPEIVVDKIDIPLGYDWVQPETW